MGSESNYDWDDMSLPYLDIKDSDFFEDVKLLRPNRYLNLAHFTAIFLVKVRLMLHLQALQEAHEDLGPGISQDVLDALRRCCASSIVANNPVIIAQDDQAEYLAKVTDQVGKLHTYIRLTNEHFWPALTHPNADINAIPNADISAIPKPYSHGDKSQAQLALKYNYAAWAETRGAINFMVALQEY